ncbi:MAG: acyl-CoA dehydrogenase family protein [Acidimicrobiia bacterium]|nr:acyl-CoA dehydrogenase family protein [Acidimicrobiia bacterium]MBP8180689.1 acyl-CoA dehydrogenase family protein [Acidimicrobiia bacterium]
MSQPVFNLKPNEDQEQIQDWVHGFARDVMRPAAEEWDEKEETPWPILEEAAKIGLYSAEGFAQMFASDPTGLTGMLVNEELFWGDAGIALSIMGTGLAVAALAGNGTPEQLFTWIGECFGTPGDLKMAAFCATEPDAGSDVSSFRTRARKDGDDWVLNGQKIFATNGGIADVHVVVAAVEPDLGSRGHAAFVIPPKTPGLSQGKKEKKLGIRASHTAEVILEDVRLPAECLLGGEEKLMAKIERAREGQKAGKQPAMSTFEATRPIVAAQAVGIARAAYEYALDYAKQRVQFGRPIIENQAIAFMLADMKTEIDAARLLCWRAAWMAATHQEFKNAEGSMSKLKAGRTAVWVAERAVQIFGGYGYVRDFPVQRLYRDAKIYDIFEGTEQIQQLVISRAISGMRIQ